MNEKERLLKKLAGLYDEAQKICIRLLALEACVVEPGCGARFLPREFQPPGFWGDDLARDLSRVDLGKDVTKRERRELCDREQYRLEVQRYDGKPSFDELIRNSPITIARASERLEFRVDDPDRKPKTQRHARALRFVSSHGLLTHNVQQSFRS